MEPALKPALLSIPLLGHSWLRQTTLDPQSWAESIRAISPVRICEPLRLSRPFRNDSAILPLGGVVVLATQGSAIAIVSEGHPFAQLLIPYRGWGLWRVERRGFENPVGESVLYLPPAPLSLENDITSGVALNLNPTSLINTALTMAGPEGLPARRMGVFEEPKVLLTRDPQSAPLIRHLYALMMNLDQLTKMPATDLERSRMEDALIRLVVLLLLPELRLRDPLSVAPVPSASARRKIEALLEWIEAHLESPISLSDLEARAYWSRRTLLDAFHEACGCGPMQWVRRRRLQRAMRRLTNPQPEDTLTSIGLSVGFSGAVAFSREFRRQYGCAPSTLFRT
ncbi:MAG: helix-turn-helix domain-containing protein [Cyanobacteriota bacterium]